MDRQFFFIIGSPRSGTTMLQMALNRHSRVLIPPETHFFSLPYRSRRGQIMQWRRIQKDLGVDVAPPPRRLTRDESVWPYYVQLMDAYIHKSRLDYESTGWVGEKSNDHTKRVDLIVRAFPDAKFLLVDRDGRDVALSLMKVPWMPHDLELCFALWLHYQRIQGRALQEHAGRIFRVRYEDLVTAPESWLRAITGFLGLDYEPEMARGSGNRRGIPDFEMGYKKQAIHPISTHRVGNWHRELSPGQVGRLERMGGRVLQALGYDLAATLPARPLSLAEWARLGLRGASWGGWRMACMLMDEWFSTHFDWENRRLQEEDPNRPEASLAGSAQILLRER